MTGTLREFLFVALLVSIATGFYLAGYNDGSDSVKKTCEEIMNEAIDEITEDDERINKRLGELLTIIKETTPETP